MPRPRLFLLALALLPALVFTTHHAPAPAAQVRRAGVTLPGRSPKGPTLLPNGWTISPAGRAIGLPGDLPLQMAVTPDGRFLIVNTGGYHDHSVNVINMATERITQSVNVGKDWDGLCITPKGDAVYVSGGGAPDPDFLTNASAQGTSASMMASFHKPVLQLRLTNGTLSAPTGIDVAGLDESEQFVSGLAAGRDGAIFAANIANNGVYKLTGGTLATQGFTGAGVRPSGVAVSPDGSVVAISGEGDSSVTLLNTDTLDTIARIPVGIHPNALVYSKDGRLFVACAGSSTVSVIHGTVLTETISTALTPDAKVGATPDALAVTPDGKRLYIANAGSNSVEVVDISTPGASEVLGFIPTGWYPTALAVSPDGRKIWIGTAKGLSSRANIPPLAPNPELTDPGHITYDYIGNILSGTVSVVDTPDAKTLNLYTRQVVRNTPVPRKAFTGQMAQMVDGAFAAFTHITHVLYIIRENRTYDQVLGDVPSGNGAPGLTMFGRAVTPNAHALALQTSLLDNLYTNGEVSEDGHQWCDAAYATDYTEKTWPGNYGGRGEPDPDARVSASPAGYLWDACRRHGVSYYSYGEFAKFTSSPSSPPVYQVDSGLAGHASRAWASTSFDQHDTLRAAVFLSDLKKAETSGKWPQFMVMSLPEDHTQGLAAGKYTPVAHVAANDLALGQIVQGVSRSRFWQSTAIFVIEDDAQNGPDHVDAHRTVGMVISPYTRRGVTDSTFYTTASFVRTMELILKLPPMTQFDEAATPLYSVFTPTPNLAPLRCLTPGVSIETRNPATGPGAQASAHLDLSAPDRADPDALNRILWQALRPGVPLPAPVRSALLPR